MERVITVWPEVRDLAREYFSFWPNGEDLIWCKTVWPALENAGFFSDFSDDATTWTRSKVVALSTLYAESASRIGTSGYKNPIHLERTWLMSRFGSESALDETLEEVGRVVRDYFAPNCDRDPAFFTPLIRSLVTGSGAYYKGQQLQEYLTRVEQREFDMCEFREDELCRMWVGGHFASGDMECLL